MNRRDFFKKTLLLAAVSSLSGKAIGLFEQAYASKEKLFFVTAGKLGYKEKAPTQQVKANKTCKSCKHFKTENKSPEYGQCTLASMKNTMKSKAVYVKSGGYCNMWAKK